MTEPKWTPGPWRRNKYGSIGGGTHGTEPIVASVEPFYGVDTRWGDHTANANLIAAAPELYEALAYLFRVCHDEHASADDDRMAKAKALVALAKARGEV